MEKTCPRCGSAMTHDTVAAVFRCKMCGKVVDAPRETLEQAAARLAARGPRPDVKVTHRGEVDQRVRVIFETGHERLWLGDKAGAAAEFRKALEIQPNFTDAHLWLARLADDPVSQRDHLAEIVAHDPAHHEAMVMLMALDGRLSPEQAETLLKRPHAPAPAPQPAEAVAASTAALLCPKCGGHLTVADDGQVVCRFCGHVLELEEMSALDQAGDVLGAVLLQRRAQPVRWLVGSRLIHCPQCGAERTLLRGQMASRCTFCGSAQVVVQDALGMFEQPDGLIPFRVDEAAAKAAVHDALNGLGERVRGLMARTNKVVSATLEGVFLPFWVFDALVEVTVTRRDRNAGLQDRRFLQMGLAEPRRETFRDGLTGLFVPAASSPPRELVAELGPFDMDTMRPYEPALLAARPAELYAVDVDQASLDARSTAARRARERALADASSSDEVSVTALPLQMSFMLVLAPVWVGILTERDGDLRTALVHGLTGEVVIGRARKPESPAR